MLFTLQELEIMKKLVSLAAEGQDMTLELENNILTQLNCLIQDVDYFDEFLTEFGQFTHNAIVNDKHASLANEIWRREKLDSSKNTILKFLKIHKELLGEMFLFTFINPERYLKIIIIPFLRELVPY